MEANINEATMEEADTAKAMQTQKPKDNVKSELSRHDKNVRDVTANAAPQQWGPQQRSSSWTCCPEMPHAAPQWLL